MLGEVGKIRGGAVVWFTAPIERKVNYVYACIVHMFSVFMKWTFQGEVYDFSEEMQTISGEVRTSSHLPTKSGLV